MFSFLTKNNIVMYGTRLLHILYFTTYKDEYLNAYEVPI